MTKKATQETLFDIPEDWREEWEGMPEYEHNDIKEHQKLIVRFRNKEDVEAFAKLIGQEHINEATTSIWYPKLKFANHFSKRYFDEDKVSLKEHFTTEEIEIKNIKGLIRHETSDMFIFEEIFKKNTYNKLNIKPNDIVLDVGLNIGAFTLYAQTKGAIVHGYEPEEDNFTLAKYNIELNNLPTKTYLNKKALVGNDDVERQFSINVKRNKSAHSLVAKRGRDSTVVQCININKVLEEVKPTIIKMDIEGGEYECINSIKDFSGIREFIIEFHHNHLNDFKTREKYHHTLDILKTQFSNVVYSENPKGAWVTLIYCKNES